MSFCSTSVSSPAVMGMAAWEQSTHPRPDTMNKGAQRVAELRRLEQITIAKTCNRLQHIYIYISYIAIHCYKSKDLQLMGRCLVSHHFKSFQILFLALPSPCLHMGSVRHPRHPSGVAQQAIGPLLGHKSHK